MPPTDDFDPAGFQAFCAEFGIKTTPFTDAFGRADFRLDRAAVERLAALKRLADSYQAGDPLTPPPPPPSQTGPSTGSSRD